MQPDTVLPSIEDDITGLHDTFVERPDEGGLHHETITPKPKSHVQVQPHAPRAERHMSVLEGGIVKRPSPNVKARKPLPRRQPHPASASSSQPSIDDLFFLLMHRTRRAKDRELELAASHKKLYAQVHHLHQENRTYHQQLTAAHARTERQDSEIVTYRSEIENFKSRFTKFKNYAKDLAKDYTDMETAMNEIRSTTNELVRDKADINRSLDSLRKTSASATEMLVGLAPKISAAACKAWPLQQALDLAKERVRITESCLHHERLRNNRIETHILDAQQLQERLSLSSMQEYRKAAVYLDDLCQAIIYLSKIVIKKQQPRDTPGVVECLNLLQTLAKKQDTGITTLTDAKTLVRAISER